MQRPGGLTALAVFNFIIGGWSLLSALALAAALSMGSLDRGGKGGQPPPPELLIQLRLVFLVIDTGLLVAAGVGYLKLKRVLGRYVGTLEAVLGLINFAVIVGIATSEGFPFSFSWLTHLVYPVLTLILLNVVFRENLVR